MGAGGKQRTDSTHVIAAVRDLNRLELAGESVRAAVEAIAVAAPDWLPTVIDIADWGRRYGARVDTWRLPTSKTKRAELAAAYGTDAVTLLRAVYDTGAPPWLRELPAVEVLRRVLLQNYVITTNAAGREVIRAREADTDGLPPGRTRLASPYDLDARWAAKGDDLYWNGYKVHVTETCDLPEPAPGDGDPSRSGTQAGPARARTGRRRTAEHHHRGGDHGRDRAGRRDDRADPRHAGRAGSAARRALPRLGLPVRGAGGGQPAPLGGHPGHPAAGRYLPPGHAPAPGTTGPASPSTSTPSRRPARRDRTVPGGTRSPNAAPTPS